MSLEAIRWATSDAPQIRTARGVAPRALLQLLADMANERHGHACWPTVQYLADRLGCSERSVQRYLGQLEAVGDIAIRVGAGRNKRNVITFPALSGGAKGDNPVTFSSPEKVTKEAVKGDKIGAEKVTGLSQKGDRFVTPINQPVNNLQSDNRKTSIINSDEDDFAAPFRAELAGIANRSLTDGERAVLNAAGNGDADGRRMLGVALDRLRARWPEIVKRSDVGGWLATTLRNLADEDAQLVDNAAGQLRQYEPDAPADEIPATLDELRMEHAIAPEPLPPHTRLWHETLAALRLELPAGTVQQWLRGLEAVGGDDGALRLAGRNAEPVPERLHRVCERTLRSVAGRHVALEFVGVAQ